MRSMPNFRTNIFYLAVPDDDDHEQAEFEEFERSKTSFYEEALDIIFNRMSNLDYSR